MCQRTREVKVNKILKADSNKRDLVYIGSNNINMKYLSSCSGRRLNRNGTNVLVSNILVTLCSIDTTYWCLENVSSDLTTSSKPKPSRQLHVQS